MVRNRAVRHGHHANTSTETLPEQQHSTACCVRGCDELSPPDRLRVAGSVAVGDARDAVQTTRASGNSALDPTRLTGLRTRHGSAVAFSRTHNRYRDWQEGNHSGYALARWSADHADEVQRYNAFEVK